MMPATTFPLLQSIQSFLAAKGRLSRMRSWSGTFLAVMLANLRGANASAAI
jgi:hypothetical protein